MFNWRNYILGEISLLHYTKVFRRSIRFAIPLVVTSRSSSFEYTMSVHAGAERNVCYIVVSTETPQTTTCKMWTGNIFLTIKSPGQNCYQMGISTGETITLKGSELAHFIIIECPNRVGRIIYPLYHSTFGLPRPKHYRWPRKTKNAIVKMGLFKRFPVMTLEKTSIHSHPVEDSIIN